MLFLYIMFPGKRDISSIIVLTRLTPACPEVIKDLDSLKVPRNLAPKPHFL
jgi:hypothetical protein